MQWWEQDEVVSGAPTSEGVWWKNDPTIAPSAAPPASQLPAQDPAPAPTGLDRLNQAATSVSPDWLRSFDAMAQRGVRRALDLPLTRPLGVEDAKQFGADLMKPVAGPGEIIPKPSRETIQNALRVPVGDLNAVPLVTDAAQAVAEIPSNIAEFTTSPVGVASFGIGELPKIAQRLIAAGFSTQQIHEAIHAPNNVERIKNLLFAAGAGLGVRETEAIPSTSREPSDTPPKASGAGLPTDSEQPPNTPTPSIQKGTRPTEEEIRNTPKTATFPQPETKPVSSLPQGPMEPGVSVPKSPNEEVLPNGEKLTPQGQTREEIQATRFETAKGSTYQVHEDGTTTRTKAPRPEHPDSGLKERSEKTVYLDPQDAERLALPTGSHWRIIDHEDGTVSVATERPDGKWGIAESQRNVPVTTTPKTGSTPLELWGKSTTQGATSYGKAHFGNEIVRPNGEVTTGVANRVLEKEAPRIGEIESGEGMSWQEMVDLGREQLNKGADPQQIARRLKNTGRISPTDFAVLRAERERLAQQTVQAEQAVRDNPNDVGAQQAYNQARSQETAWVRDVVQPAKTQTSDIFRGMQGEAPVDVSTFAGMRRAVVDLHGREPTLPEVRALSEASNRVKQATAESVRSLQDATSRIERRYGRRAPKRDIDALRNDLHNRLKELTPC